jgi:hypothetical protein
MILQYLVPTNVTNKAMKAVIKPLSRRVRVNVAPLMGPVDQLIQAPKCKPLILSAAAVAMEIGSEEQAWIANSNKQEGWIKLHLREYIEPCSRFLILKYTYFERRTQRSSRANGWISRSYKDFMWVTRYTEVGVSFGQQWRLEDVGVEGRQRERSQLNPWNFE